MLERWLENAGASLKERADQVGWRQTVERDFQRAMEATRPASSLSVVLEHWPGVGPIDLVDERALGVELKWCRSGDALCNAAWDIAKLATALAEGAIGKAWIAAGAPVAHWISGAPGVELFELTRHDDDILIRHYESWWRFWCKEVATRPTHLPEGFAVSETVAVRVTLEGEPFELRAARVEVTSTRWRAHVCPHVWRGETCRPRP